MKSYFFPQSIYTAILAFADKFNDLTVRVYDKNNKIIGIKPVPLSLTPKEKIAAILTKNDVNDVDPQVDNYLPRISINLSGMNLDAQRQRGKFEKRLLNIEYDLETNKRSMQVDVQYVPYILSLELTIWTKYMIDGVQLVEYITSFFCPQDYISYKERNFGIEHKSQVKLNNISPNFAYDLNETDRRVLSWTLSFDMEIVIYKPIEIIPEIRCTKINIGDVSCNRIPIQKEKVEAYEPVTPQFQSINTKNTNVSISDIDASTAYDNMIKYWAFLNNVMVPVNSDTCVLDNCNNIVSPRPTPDPSLDVTSCGPIKLPPCISQDSSGNIINYWQDLITGPDNIIRLVSYKRVYDSKGNDISGPDIIPNEDYPQSCYPVYTGPITSIPPTSVSPTSSPITPPITSIPPTASPDPCIVPPNYNTTAS